MSAQPLWVAILFGIVHLSTRTRHGVSIDHVSILPQRCLLAAAECLVVGRYNIPQESVDEAICLFIHCQVSSRLDIPYDLVHLLSIACQIAYTMGFSRDMENSTQDIKLSIFKKEMCRRTWSFLMQLDLSLSTLYNLPSKIQPLTWTTPLPGNYLDVDMREDAVRRAQKMK